MNQDTAIKNIGINVLASDPYWGSYIGSFVGILKTHIGVRARVKIEKCVEYPSQRAIIFTENRFTRIPYEHGSIKSFDLENVVLCEDQEGMTLEDLLKGIVIKAVAEKLGHPVSISTSDWEEARTETLRDVYVNRFCFFSNVTSEYFCEAMATYLAIKKRIAA